MTIEELEKILRTGNLDSIYLLYGEEQYLLEQTVKKIKKNFGELVNGINYIQMDEKNIETLISDIETPAFGYANKLIIARNTGIFKREARGKKKDEKQTKKTTKGTSLQEKIANYIEENISNIKESVVIVFIEQEIGTNDLSKTIQNLGTTCNFEKLKPIQIAKRIKGITNAYKVNIDDRTLDYFIETCGTSMLTLINEIRKLKIEYAGENGTITTKDIDLLSIKELDSVIFDLTDSLGKKDIANALQILKELLYNKEPIQKILITLYNHLKKIYLTMLADEYRVNIAETLNLKPNQMFLTTKYKKQASYFKKEELRNTLQALIDLDYKTKQGQLDINVGLEAILCMI
jgi:DNA polymerase-3 subunit delta